MCDFLLWSCLKKVWIKPLEKQPKNLIEPCASIVAVCNDLEPEMIVRALITMISGARKCVDVDGNIFLANKKNFRTHECHEIVCFPVKI